jgi:hypothetical protein
MARCSLRRFRASGPSGSAKPSLPSAHLRRIPATVALPVPDEPRRPANACSLRQGRPATASPATGRAKPFLGALARLGGADSRRRSGEPVSGPPSQVILPDHGHRGNSRYHVRWRLGYSWNGLTGMLSTSPSFFSAPRSSIL